jgi:hypothetical protein
MAVPKKTKNPTPHPEEKDYVIRIKANGAYSGGVTLDSVDHDVTFEVVSWPKITSGPNKGKKANVCSISFVMPAQFTYDPDLEPILTGGGTIKVGS